MNKTVVAIVLCLVLGNCACYAQRELSPEAQKPYLPKGTIKFELAEQPFMLTDTAVVSANAVYTRSGYFCGAKCDSSFTYMRFFEDGRVFVSFSYLSYPGVAEFNDLSYGKFGRYRIEEGGILKVELYMDRQHGVMYMFAKPVSQDIQFYKTTGRGAGQVLKVTKTKKGGFYRKGYVKLYNK